MPVAEKVARQKKRKASQDVPPVGDDEKRWCNYVGTVLIVLSTRLSKRARAPPAIYESPDPDMAQILETIKKQEEKDKRGPSPSDNEEEQPKEEEKPKVKPKIKAEIKAKVLPPRKMQKKSIVESDSEQSESDPDEPPSPKLVAKSRTKKPAAKKVEAPTAKGKKADPVFFK